MEGQAAAWPSFFMFELFSGGLPLAVASGGYYLAIGAALNLVASQVELQHKKKGSANATLARK